MNHWLIKFAPYRYSWQDVLRNGRFGIYIKIALGLLTLLYLIIKVVLVGKSLYSSIVSKVLDFPK